MNLKELEKLDKKYNLLKKRVYREAKEPSIFFNEELYDWQDWAEIELAKKTTKYFRKKMKYITKDANNKSRSFA